MEEDPEVNPEPISIFARFKQKLINLQEDQQPSSSNKFIKNDPLFEQKLEGVEQIFPFEDTAWKRIKSLFRKDPTYQIWPLESAITMTSSLVVFGVGFVAGGLKRNREMLQLFRRQHATTAFISRGDAVRRLFDYTFVMFMKNGFIHGARMGSVVFVTMATVSICTAASKKFHPLYFAGGGAASGAVYCFPRGPAASLVGAVLGFGSMLIGGYAFSVPLSLYSGLGYTEVYKLARIEYYEAMLVKIREDMELQEFINQEKYWFRSRAKKELEKRKLEAEMFGDEEDITF